MPDDLNLPKSKLLPYYGVKRLGTTIRESSKMRGMSPLRFTVRKILNYCLAMTAYFCPINSIRVWLHRWRGVRIGEGVFIGLHCVLDSAYPEYIVLEDRVMLAGGNHLLAHSRAPEYYKGKLLSYVAPIHIGRYSWIGINAVLLADSQIGEGVVVSAGSIVAGTFPDHVLLQGNPAQIVRTFEEDNAA